LFNNSKEVYRRIHKVDYSKIFGSEFQVKAIDNQLDEKLQLEQQLCLLDHVIDYVYVNFRDLSHSIDNSKQTLSQALLDRQKNR